MSEFNASLFNAAFFGGTPPAGAPLLQAGHGILYPALRKAGVTLGPGRTPSPAQFQDAIDELNRLTGTLNCDRLFIYSVDSAQYPLISMQASYTIGEDPEGILIPDFPAPRPQLIDSANIIAAGGIRYRLALPDALAWSRINRYPFTTGTIPTYLYNDRAFPLSTLTFWPPPSTGMILELFTWHQVPYFLSLTDVVSLPMQYLDALTLNLAVRLVSQFPLAPNVPRQVDPNLYQQARESLMRLESINAPQPILLIPSFCRGSGWNVYSDGYDGSIYPAGKP